MWKKKNEEAVKRKNFMIIQCNYQLIHSIRKRDKTKTKKKSVHKKVFMCTFFMIFSGTSFVCVCAENPFKLFYHSLCKLLDNIALTLVIQRHISTFTLKMYTSRGFWILRWLNNISIRWRHERPWGKHSLGEILKEMGIFGRIFTKYISDKCNLKMERIN